MKIAIFASGSGSNAINIINYFKNHQTIRVEFVLTNRKDALVIEKAKISQTKVIISDNELVSKSEYLSEVCQGIDYIILAGYLRLIPKEFIEIFKGKIINIHPSILPKFGGRGFYGENVHKAVIESGEKQSGITIHYVNENFDEGDYISQFYCQVDRDETYDSLAKKIGSLEQMWFPKVLESVLI